MKRHASILAFGKQSFYTNQFLLRLMRPYPYLRISKMSRSPSWGKVAALVLLIVMVMSVLGAVADYQRGDVQRFKGIKFSAGTNVVHATINDIDYQFSTFPKQVASLPL